MPIVESVTRPAVAPQQAVVIGTRPETADATIKNYVELGIRH
jgi:hypothetical protein